MACCLQVVRRPTSALAVRRGARPIERRTLLNTAPHRRPHTRRRSPPPDQLPARVRHQESPRTSANASRLRSRRSRPTTFRSCRISRTPTARSACPLRCRHARRHRPSSPATSSTVCSCIQIRNSYNSRRTTMTSRANFRKNMATNARCRRHLQVTLRRTRPQLNPTETWTPTSRTRPEERGRGLRA